MLYHLKILIVFCGILLGSIAKCQEYKINIPEGIKNTEYSRQFIDFYTAVYAELGIKPRFIFMPAKRSFIYLKDNKIQAEAYRAKYVGDLNNLPTKLEPVISEVHVALFCFKQEMCKVNTNNIYAIPSGFEYGRYICNELKLTCEYINNTKLIAKMLDQQLIDAFLSPYPLYKKILCNSNNVNFYFEEIPEHFIKTYHYISSRNAEFINKVQTNLAKHLAQTSLDFSQLNGLPSLNNCNKTIQPNI